MQKSNAWLWVPTLYFAQGIPYAVVMSMSKVFYKNTGMDNADLAFYTGWLYLPWVIKPLWSPLVDMFRTKRFFIVGLQCVIGAALAAVALTIKASAFVQLSLAGFWLIAFSSATHDIAADGFYMLGMPTHQQATYVGVRSIFWRLAQIAAQGGLVWLAGHLGEQLGDVRLGWTIVFGVLAAMFGLIGAWHACILPRPADDRAAPPSGSYLRDFGAVFASFFRRGDILLILGFLLTYRLGESQLVAMVTPFLLDPVAKGGLGLSTADVGIAYGTIGFIALVAGGVLGGLAAARWGLKRSLWWMVCAIHLPDLVFVFLATTLPQNFALVCASLAVEQFGYGFGFTAYLLYMMMVAEQSEQKTAHYAICTGFMALGMMLPGMASGWIQQQIGYQHFFLWVCAATIPAFAMAALVKIDPAYGKK